MVSKLEYGKREVEAAHRVLIELMQILGVYRDKMVLVGGWVPYFYYGETHIGSMDIDIALDKEASKSEAYMTIRKLLESHGYKSDDKQQFIYRKEIHVNEGKSVTVEVDFLAAEYGGTGKSHRTQRIQDIHARKARACDLAFEYYKHITIQGIMPDGAMNTVELKLSALVPFIVMKGMALYDRLKAKDAYDLYFTFKNYPGGVLTLAEEFRPMLTNGLVKEGLSKIRAKFESVNSFGPASVVEFEAIEDREESDRLKRDVFEVVNTLLDTLAITVYAAT